jgi:hypothetical protein
VKLPIGVALFHSLGYLVMPCEPMCARTDLPCLSHPPPDAFVHACNRATVLAFDEAVTVITRVAVPVRNDSGSRTPVVAEAGTGATASIATALNAATDAASTRRNGMVPVCQE